LLHDAYKLQEIKDYVNNILGLVIAARIALATVRDLLQKEFSHQSVPKHYKQYLVTAD
jgi:hypothetical protein